MPKLIYAIKTRNKSFNLLEEVHKDFGVVFHPNSTVSSVETLIKEKANANTGTPKASSEVRQSDIKREGFVGKTEKASGKEKADGMDFTSN